MAPKIIWRNPPASSSLCPGQVHLWRVSLDQPQALVQQASSLLSIDEKARATKYRFARDRNRYIVGRAALRSIAGRYLHLPPRQPLFFYTEYGKPFLAPDTNPSDIRFNLAHAQEVAVIALTTGREVGLDLEFVKPIPDAAQIAALFFSHEENRELLTLPLGQRQDAFYRCWTRKEAYVKAIGEGLSHPLDRFQVSLAPNIPARLISVEGSPQEIARWEMISFDPAPGYIAALVVEGPGSEERLEHWHFRPEGLFSSMDDEGFQSMAER
jgi:4'-phosphopantetheinyl transferase